MSVACRPAVYRQQSHPLLQGNPFAMVLPPIPTDKEAFQWLDHRPPARPDGFKDLPLEERLLYLGDLPHRTVPLSTSVYIFQQIVRAAHASFFCRDPRNPRFMEALLELGEGRTHLLQRLVRDGGGPRGMLLVGITGAGKTRLADRVVEYFGEDPILHTSIDDRPCKWLQLSVVWTQCRATVKSTFNAASAAVDGRLHTDYYLARESTRSRSGFENVLVRATSSHGCPLLMLHDLQNVSQFAEEAKFVMDALCNFMEDTGVPVLCSSTWRINPVYANSVMHSSKLQGAGRFVMDALPYGADFRRVLQAHKEMHVSVRDVKYSPDFDRLAAIYTMGVPRFICFLMDAIFRRHAHDEKLVANRGLLDSINDEELAPYRDALEVLRRVRHGMPISEVDRQRYEDLLPEVPAKQLKVLPEEVQKLEKRGKKKETPDEAQEPSPAGRTRRTGTATPKRSSTAPSIRGTRMLDIT